MWKQPNEDAEHKSRIVRLNGYENRISSKTDKQITE